MCARVFVYLRVGTLAYVCVFWVCICVAACVSLRISVFLHNDIVLCYGVEELLNPELSLTMTSSIMLMQNVCLSVMGGPAHFYNFMWHSVKK